MELNLYPDGERALFWRNFLIHMEIRARARFVAQNKQWRTDFLELLDMEIRAEVRTHGADSGGIWVGSRRLQFPNPESLAQFVLTWS
jgi:hypothetical protein